MERTEFELNVTEDPPTSDQLRTILEYIGAKRAGDVVKGAKNEADAMKKLRESGENFTRPVVSVGRWMEEGTRAYGFCRLWIGTMAKQVSWEVTVEGRLLTRKVIGEDESAILNMIRQLPKETDKV